jgi:alginate O-acetyltransferase complex protein AlgI
VLFSDYQFIFFFLPLCLLGYYAFLNFEKIRAAKIWVIFCSLAFYSLWNILDLPILLSSILFNFFLAQRLHTSRSKKGLLLTFGVVANLLMLGYYKYSAFFWAMITGTPFTVGKSHLPLGISFFTFHQIAYLFVAYRSELNNRSKTDYFFFISFFPQLIAGPIVLYKQMIPLLMDKERFKWNPNNFSLGILAFSIGIFKKAVIADALAPIANIAFSESSTDMIRAWLSVLGYTFQLYFDFSGYMDMALGMALMFNLTLPLNFNSPFRSLNIADFWRRWHMTLTNFLTNYIFNPISVHTTRLAVKNKFSKQGFFWFTIALPTLITFILAGLWHGAGKTFIIFGLAHGVAIVVYRFWQTFKKPLPKPIAWLLTFAFVAAAFTIFRAETMEQAKHILKTMFDLHTWGIRERESLPNLVLVLCALVIALLPSRTEVLLTKFKPNFKWLAYSVLLFCSALMLTNKQVEFLYWQF